MACPTKFLHLCNYIGVNDWRRFYLAILFGLIRMSGRLRPACDVSPIPCDSAGKEVATLLDQPSLKHVIKDIII